MSRQSRFDAGYWMLGAGALGGPRGMVQGRMREEGSGWGTQCIPVADSYWYMAKPIQYCKVKKYNTIKKNTIFWIDIEKDFNKIKQQFMIKKKNSPERNLSQHNKGHTWQTHCKYYPQWWKTESYSHQDSMLLVQKQKYRHMEQNRKLRQR